MTPERDLARRLANHFADEAPRLAPDWILPSALTTIETTNQRRGLLAPWRFPLMPAYAKAGAIAAAALAVVAVAIWQLNANGPAHPASSPSPVPSTGPSSAATGYAVPPLSRTFTSSIYGLSISYPETWTDLAGRTPWPDAATYTEPQGDLLYDPTRDLLFLKVASQPLGSTSFEDWAAAVFGGRECPGPATTVTVDGAQGLMDRGCYAAVVESGGRGYLMVAHWNADIGELRSVDWAAFLDQVLATVHFEPDMAIDAP